MNLIIRMLWIILKDCLRFSSKGPKGLSDEYRIKFRAYPHDCDLNFHLTASRYLAFCDLARVDMLLRSKTFYRFLRKGWFPVVNAQSAVYIKSVLPFQKVVYRSHFIGLDEKYWYFEHKGYIGEKLALVVMVRGVFIKKGKIVSTQVIHKELAGEESVPELKPTFLKWKAFLAEKKSL